MTLPTFGHTECWLPATWEILARALAEDRIVMSADSDFSLLQAAQEAERPSFILFQEPDLRAAPDYISVLLPLFPLWNRNW